MVIAADDVLAPMLNDIDDVERVLPGTIDVMREWLRLYNRTSLGQGASHAQRHSSP